VSFATITLCVASQRVFIVIVVVYFIMTQSGNFWIYPRTHFPCHFSSVPFLEQAVGKHADFVRGVTSTVE
jgi:hypothetical protein